MSIAQPLTQRPVSVILLDNFDSFTYNLVDELRVLGFQLTVYRNNVSAQVVYQHMLDKSDTHNVLLMLSPGPGTPKQAGCLLELIELVKGQFPILGICLGHQAIVESLGGKVVRCDEVMHGKSSLIHHDNSEIFIGLPNPLPVARYHSLMASEVPECLSVIAYFGSIPMSVIHHSYNILGYQFHPESILTSQGSQLLDQSIKYLIQKD